MLREAELGSGYTLLKPAPSDVLPPVRLHRLSPTSYIAVKWGASVQTHEPMEDISHANLHIGVWFALVG